jgi:hypothetical protein
MDGPGQGCCVGFTFIEAAKLGWLNDQRCHLVLGFVRHQELEHIFWCTIFWAGFTPL